MLVTQTVTKAPPPSEEKSKIRSRTKDRPVFYPESDGKPMAETDIHRILLLELVGVLQYAFPEAYVSGNICLYYEEGNPKKMISPDVLLCRSQSRDIKRVYLAWEPDAQLDLVIELSSASTKRVDYNKKKQLYAEILQVPYYVIFDPERLTLNAFVLQDGEYQDLKIENGHCTLDKLNISLGIDTDRLLRVFDRYGRPVLTSDERAEQAEGQLEQAKAQAKQAEGQLEQVKEQVTQAKGQMEQAKERAEHAEEHAIQREQENQRLREELEALRRQLDLARSQ